MFSPQVIADLALQAAVKAAANELEPYHPASASEIAGWGTGRRQLPVPNLGDYRPAGWHLVDHELVDATGGGYESEPALTLRGFKAWATECLAKDPTAGFGTIEVGQFQVVVGWFSQDANVPAESDSNGKTADELPWHACPKCDAPVSDSETVCPECDWDTAAKHCPECDEEVDDDDKVCPVCKAKLGDDDESEDEEEADDEPTAEVDRWEEGWQAYEAGTPESDNPHERGTQDWYDWQSGWTTAGLLPR